MSVNVNARRVNRAIYVKKAQDLHLLTIRNISNVHRDVIEYILRNYLSN